MTEDQIAATGSEAAPKEVESEARLESLGEDWAAGVNAVPISPRSRRLRWGVAIGIVVCVAIVTALGAFVLTGAGGTKSLTAGYVPKGSVMFMNVRTDLPGDQHAKLADFMTHFPGWKDRAQFDSGFDELLNKFTAAISPELSYTSAFKPWMGGEIAVAVTGLSLPHKADAAVIVAVKDRAKAEQWVESETSAHSMKVSVEDYAGAKVYTLTSALADSDTTTAYAITDKVALLGTPSAVKACLDAPAKGALEGDATYKAAMNSFSGDRVASFYMAMGPLMGQMFGPLADQRAIPQNEIDFVLGRMPAWLAGSVRVESDRVVVEMAMPRIQGSLDLGNHKSALASRLPASTVGLVEVHSVGRTVMSALGLPDTAPSEYRDWAQTIIDTLRQIGGLDWLGDVSLAVTQDGDTLSGGLVAQATDSETASVKLGLISNLLGLSSLTTGITTHQETYKGVVITVAHLPGSGALGLPEAVDVALACKGELLIAGRDIDFVKAVIDTTPGTSLAAQSDYKAVMGVAGESNAGAVYVNVGAVAKQRGPALSGSTYYDQYLKPYFDHLGAAALSRIDGQVIMLRLVMMAK